MDNLTTQARADERKPFPADPMQAEPVGTRVNNPSNDHPTCAEAW